MFKRNYWENTTTSALKKVAKKDDLKYRTAGVGVRIETENLYFKFKQTHCIQIEKN